MGGLPGRKMLANLNNFQEIVGDNEIPEEIPSSMDLINSTNKMRIHGIQLNIRFKFHLFNT